MPVKLCHSRSLHFNSAQSKQPSFGLQFLVCCCGLAGDLFRLSYFLEHRNQVVYRTNVEWIPLQVLIFPQLLTLNVFLSPKALVKAIRELHFRVWACF